MKIAALIMCACAFAALSPAGHAQTSWQPTKPIKIVVPYPPGGTADALPRLIGDKMANSLGQPVIFENRGGASANIGSEYVARAEPDGYTLLVVAPHVVTTNAVLYKLNYDPSAFAPVSIIASYPNVLVANPKMPPTLKEFIAYAKANPGKIFYGSQGNSTSSHLSGEMLKMMAGINMVHVPYKGSAPALVDLLAGQVSVMFDNLLATNQYIKSGKLRLLGVGSAKRQSAVPDAPAIGEVVPGFLSETWMGIVAPPKTPAAITTRLSAAVAEAVRSPDIVKRLEDLNTDPVGDTPAQMAEVIKQDTVRWVNVVKTAHVKAD